MGVAFLLASTVVSLSVAFLAVGVIAGKEFLLWWVEQPLIGGPVSAVLDNLSVLSLGDGPLANLFYFMIAMQIAAVAIWTVTWAVHVLLEAASAVLAIIRRKKSTG